MFKIPLIICAIQTATKDLDGSKIQQSVCLKDQLKHWKQPDYNSVSLGMSGTT